MNVSMTNTSPIVLNGYPFNAVFEEKLLPVTIILAVCAAVCTTGNTFVLLVYLIYDIAKREATYFIPFLAGFDLLASVSLATSSIIRNSFFVYFPSTIVCKTTSFATMFSSGTSAGMLFVIALQRYLKICSKGRTMTLVWRRLAVGIVTIGHILLNIPTLVFAGSVKDIIEFRDQIVEGKACRFGTGLQPMIELIYQTSVIWVFLVLIATVGLYIPIVCIVHTRKWQNKVSPQNSTIDVTGSKQSTFTGIKEQIGNINTGGRRKANGSENSQEYVTAGPSNALDAFVANASCQVQKSTNDRKQKSKAKGKSRESLASRNFNLMLTTIVISYAVSYFQSSATLIISGLIGNNIYSFPTWARNAYRILQKFAMINHIINSFIYVYFDLQFRSIVNGILNID